MTLSSAAAATPHVQPRCRRRRTKRNAWWCWKERPGRSGGNTHSSGAVFRHVSNDVRELDRCVPDGVRVGEKGRLKCAFLADVEAGGVASLPQFVKDEFDAFLECGILAHGFVRVRCVQCAHEKLVAFSCKRRGICPSCGARRMAETAAWLVDHVIPKVPVRQWVLSFPIPLRRRST